jgi:hypothetical protein
MPSIDICWLAIKTNEISKTHVVAFGPHVQEELLAAARDAGCNLVVSRGQFFAQIKTILQQNQRALGEKGA